jgi:Ca2+-binding RTX toxin-like protein
VAYTPRRGLEKLPARRPRCLRLLRPLGACGLLALVLAASAFAATLYGTDGPDRIIGTTNDDLIQTYAGADYVSARGGFDDVFAGRGRDEVYGGRDGDQLYGGDGRDKLSAGCPGGDCDPGHDNILYGGDGDDTLAADNGRADVVDGGLGWDACYVDSLDFWSRCEVLL